MELKPTMTKEKALRLVLDYAQKHGYPVQDVILDGDFGPDNKGVTMVNEWTFNGLCKLLLAP